ncbi:protein STPG3-like [Tubulanus polymorphus]|uniref:protein STPG3-like n=1 Tax=Tubulanus polymorphus TaxID=672921 RepID=UPI003DA60A9B
MDTTDPANSDDAETITNKENIIKENSKLSHQSSGSGPDIIPHINDQASSLQFPRLPSPYSQSGVKHESTSVCKSPFRAYNRSKIPPAMVKIATVTMASSKPRSRRDVRPFVETPTMLRKVVTYDEAINSRPPLRIDMEGPTPWSYTPISKPLQEKNAPAYSFGRKCHPEKGGGGRTSWEKPWFSTPHIWCDKVDFYRDRKWPAPTSYRHKSLLGRGQNFVPEAPSFTIGSRQNFSISKKGCESEPSPNDYNPEYADHLTHRTGAAFSHQFRRGGTILWNNPEPTPDPCKYNPDISKNRQHRPNFSIGVKRREIDHSLGPFASKS